MSNCTNAINSTDVFMQANFVLNENPNVIFLPTNTQYPSQSTVQSRALLNVALLQCAESPLSPQKISRTFTISYPFVHPSTATVREILLAAIAYNVAPVKMENHYSSEIDIIIIITASAL